MNKMKENYKMLVLTALFASISIYSVAQVNKITVKGSTDVKVEIKKEITEYHNKHTEYYNNITNIINNTNQIEPNDIAELKKNMLAIRSASELMSNSTMTILNQVNSILDLAKDSIIARQNELKKMINELILEYMKNEELIRAENKDIKQGIIEIKSDTEEIKITVTKTDETITKIDKTITVIKTDLDTIKIHVKPRKFIWTDPYIGLNTSMYFPYMKISNSEGEERSTKTRIGFRFGGIYEFLKFLDKRDSSFVTLNTGALLIKQGYREEIVNYNVLYTLNLYYLQIPIILKVYFNLKEDFGLFFQGGPYLNIGLSGKMETVDEAKNRNTNRVYFGTNKKFDDFNLLNGGGIFGFGLRYKNVQFGFDYYLSANNIKHGSIEKECMENRGFSFNLCYFWSVKK